VQALLPKLQKRYLTYGLSAQADYRARDVHFQGLESSFEVVRSGEPLGRVEVKMPGAHNVLNALSVVAVADELGIEFGVVRDALRTFQGIQRRFSIRGEAAGVVVVDDYGHHPAEIMTTLQGARRSYPDRRIVAVFQPHRYSRIQRLWEEFSTAFNQADLVVVTDVYAANEKPRPGVSGQTMADSIRRCGHKGVSFTGDLESTVALLADQVSGRDLVITLGAGDVWRVGQELVERLERRDGPISK
jgi:UDP-N-acetylmuramate--alanine ligase